MKFQPGSHICGARRNIRKKQTIPDWYVAGFSLFFWRGEGCCAVPLLISVGFLWLWRVGATLPCVTQASHCGGLSRCSTPALGTKASVAAAHGLGNCGLWAPEHRLSSCGSQAWLVHGIWSLPRAGIDHVPCTSRWILIHTPPGKSGGNFNK